MEAEENGRKERGETCNLCGFSAKTFEPMTYYCNGAQCNGKRIGRGRYFYHASGSNQWHWCSVSVFFSFFLWGGGVNVCVSDFYSLVFFCLEMSTGV